VRARAGAQRENHAGSCAVRDCSARANNRFAILSGGQAVNVKKQRARNRMPDKKILSIGYEFPGGQVETVPLKSSQSLLDADIVLFEPNLSCYQSYGEFEGKRKLNETDSKRVQEDTKHWHYELRATHEAGKTVIIFFGSVDEVAAFSHAGFPTSGRSSKTIHYYSSIRNYDAVPLDVGTIVPKSGKAIKPAGRLTYLAPYWKEFGPDSPFEAYAEGPVPEPLLLTKSGDKIVGAAWRSSGAGTTLLLPPLRPDYPGFTKVGKSGGEYWTAKATKYGHRLVAALVALDDALHIGAETTPTPTWANGPAYLLREESLIKQQIIEVEDAIVSQQQSLVVLHEKLKIAGDLRGLLYETGPRLERSIRDALQLLGFEAEPFKEGLSEFDVVFVAPEGRCLGEAEGKDNRAVGIEKLDQLERNLREDFQSDKVHDYAHGVLFGNAFPPHSSRRARTLFYSEVFSERQT
jgi:hypothetical protein